ncbi:MAG: CehA/McbA family metallohydrolase [Clostridia bacterium]|nr:CehA/McbA family metallohydrolase [Clostridia bacterium]
MLKRFELHNHTTHSDASLTCLDLIEHMEKDRVDVFALTDHNTISGHRVVRELLSSRPSGIQCIYGMEYTTYYGHILCLNLEKYVPWDSIDRFHPEKLFEACKEAGALTGIAHPFSYGAPFARGCRFEMTVHDFSHVDFIEVFNNLEPLHEVNGRGLDWWEQLVLEGKHLAHTCGMDLHGRWDMHMHFATYIDCTEEETPAESLARAIRTMQTYVSKGLLLHAEKKGETWHFSLENVHKSGFVSADRYLMTLRGRDVTKSYEISEEKALDLPEDLFPAGPVLIPKLYLSTPDGEAHLEQLICISPPIYR